MPAAPRIADEWENVAGPGRMGQKRPPTGQRAISVPRYVKIALVGYSSMRYSRMSDGGGVRIFKLNAFARFQRRERIADVALATAIANAEAGIIDAELGGGIIKQRVARPGQGKSGGFRTVIAYRHGVRAVYLFGFATSERANLDDDELAYWRQIGHDYLALDEKSIEAAIAADELNEVKDGDEK